MAWRKVQGSQEAAIGGGMLSALLELHGDPMRRVQSVICDPDQTGDEVEMVVEMRGQPTNVFLRLRVTEVEEVPE